MAPSHRRGDGARTGVGSCPGTFGELLQGALPPGGRQFLVTLPITHRSTAEFTELPGTRGVEVFPARKEKSRRLAEELLRTFGIDAGGTLRVRSELPEGKGLASSSADMVATARAIGRACGVRVPRRVLARTMCAIEPSDGVMYRGIVSFYGQEGVLRASLGTLPPMTIVALDEGGRVETTGLAGAHAYRGVGRLAEYEDLLLGLESAVGRRHLPSVGEISTRSAILNQDVLPKRHLELFLELRALRAARRARGGGGAQRHVPRPAPRLGVAAPPGDVVRADRRSGPLPPRRPGLPHPRPRGPAPGVAWIPATRPGNGDRREGTRSRVEFFLVFSVRGPHGRAYGLY